jgi:hypothetical protein
MRVFVTLPVNDAHQVLRGGFTDRYRYGDLHGVWVATRILDPREGYPNELFEGEVRITIE